MPRPSKGPRLYLRKRAGYDPVYVIRDGEKQVSTGCTPKNAERAKEALRDYLAEHFRPDTGERRLDRISIAEVLMLYMTDLPADSPSRETIRYHVKALTPYWGEKTLADVRGSTCRAYLQARTVKPSTARQELKTMQAAINHWHRESPLSAVPKVTLPKASGRRERVLERGEVARLLWACRKLSRQGRNAPNGAIQYTDYSHVARFILIGTYTGTRHDAMLRLRWTANHAGGHTDLVRGVIHRRGIDEKQTSKRSPPVRIPGRLHVHLDRWQRSDSGKDIASGFVIHHRGQPIAKMKRAWKTVREAAGLGSDVTPHTLRHTCASWLLWGREGRGARPKTTPMTIWEVAGVLGADASTVERVYGHHRRPE